MNRLRKKLGKIVLLASAEERRFGEQAGKSQQAHQAHLDQLGSLNSYRRNYQQKNPISSTVSAAHFQDYQSFLFRLDGAVRSQEQIVSESERTVDVHRQRWMVKRQKMESLERALEKCREQDAAYASKLEQKLLDEFSNASHAARKSSDN